ncbi:MAG: putative CRISPR-associated protein [Opitutales bacterium]
MHHHIITTGISLITNWMNAQTPRSNLQDAIRHHTSVRDQFLADPLRTSAEINSLNARTDFLKNPTTSDLGVTLVYTTTEEGKLVYSIIEKYLKSKGIGRIDSMPVKGLNKPAGDATPDWAQQNVTEALEGLRDGVERHISKLRSGSPAPNIEINCTGGYKAETAILYSLGQKLDIPVYYLHESFKTCVVLP